VTLPPASQDAVSSIVGNRDGVVTVQNALELQSLRAGAPEVLAGHDQLARPIRWAHVAEVANIAGLLRGGELILTTGIGLPTADRLLRRFVAELAERRIAGLVVETGSHFKVVPCAVVEAAAAHDLPLVALHREVSFVDVTEAINDELHRRELARARRDDRLQQELTDLLIDGAGLPEVLGALAAAIKNAVVLEREDGELLFHAVNDGDSAAALSAWDDLRRELPGAVDAVEVPLAATRGGSRGRLIALAVDGPLTDGTFASIERAAGLIAIVTRQSHQEQILAARARGDLLMSLIEADLSETQIARQVASMGFPQRVAHLMPCVFRDGGPGHWPAGSDDAVRTTVWNDVRRELESQATPIIGGFTQRDGEIAMVVGLPSLKDRERRAGALADLFAAALKRSVGQPDAGVLYVGEAARSWTGVVTRLREVMEAATLPRAQMERSWYDAARPDVDRLLWTLRDVHELGAFVDRRLGPLVENDAKRRTKLLPTLEAYLSCDGHKSETARLLQVKRQSVYHRMARIEELLGESLEDEATRLGVHLAVRARRFVDAHGTAAAVRPRRPEARAAGSGSAARNPSQ
jgi:purine catabolism regulator